MLWLLLSVGGLFPLSFALEAYDCRDESAEIERIDLLGTGRCLDPSLDFLPAIEAEGQILQLTRTEPVIGRACKLTVTKEIFYCGFDHLSYGSTFAMAHLIFA